MVRLSEPPALGVHRRCRRHHRRAPSRLECRCSQRVSPPLPGETARGGKHRGAYLLAALIFSLSFCRDWAVQRAMERNPIPILPPTSTLAKRFGGPNALARGLKAAGAALVAAGSVLVLSSFARLGRVTAFPFSWFENPMYLGAVLNFLGGALYKNNAVGVGLTGVVALVYHISTTFFEGPFTAQIYANQGH
eukprot:gene1655-1023_t